MSFGIGLGAFVDAYTRTRETRLDREDRKEDRAYLAEDRAYRTKERARVEGDREAMRAIDTDAKAQFDTAVKEGTADANEFDEFWKSYALPRKKMELLRQGDIDGAEKLEKWGLSDSMLKGGRLFTSALLKAQTGDAGGALTDVIEAGKVNGYIEHGMEFLGQEEIKDEAGTVIGFRLKMKDAKGKQLEQDIAVADIPRMISTFANPDAAWQSQVASSAAKQKRGEEIEDYTTKKQVDQKYGKPGDDAESYRKVREDLLKGDLDFAAKTAEEQDAQVREALKAANDYARERAPASAVAPGGTAAPSSVAPGAAAPAPKVIVDEVTGQPVTSAAPGLGGGGDVVSNEQVGLGGARQPAPAPPPPANRQPSKQELINDAAAHMSQGGNPDQIATILMNNGVTEQEWPDTVRSAWRSKNPQ